MKSQYAMHHKNGFREKNLDSLFFMKLGENKIGILYHFEHADSEQVSSKVSSHISK